MHNRTLQQINGFYQRLMTQQHEALIENITQMSGQADLAQEGLGEPVESRPTAPGSRSTIAEVRRSVGYQPEH
jgi:hypothetical protein